MAHRQLYDDVMDVALRATLKKFGFTRKARRDYVVERPDRLWILEFDTAPGSRRGFDITIAVRFPELNAIVEKYIPDYWPISQATRTQSHIAASIAQLMEIAAGHDFYTWSRSRASENWSKAYERARSDPIMRYQYEGFWHLPITDTEFQLDDADFLVVRSERISELGLYLNRQFHEHVWKWYWRCNDLMFVVDWIEKYEDHQDPISLAILCHLAGNDEKAAPYLQSCIDESRISFEDRYRELYREKRGNWLRRKWSTFGWSEKTVMDTAKAFTKGAAERANAARSIAAAFGIRLD